MEGTAETSGQEAYRRVLEDALAERDREVEEAWQEYLGKVKDAGYKYDHVVANAWEGLPE